MKHIKFMTLAAAGLMLLAGCKQKVEAPEEPVNTDNIYQFSVLDSSNDTVQLADYKGKVLLVINSATGCGFTPQYNDLQALYERYHDQGFEILDFPCNAFGQQAPGTIEEIHEVCTSRYGVTFPQMAKVDVNGDEEEQPALFAWLIEKAPFAGYDTATAIGAMLDKMFKEVDPDYAQNPNIKWNFTKFLIDREGNVVQRFEPGDGVKPIEEAIASLL